MEKFFLQILFDLDKLTGIKQYKKYVEDKENGTREVETLVKILCRVSRSFPDVPPDAQKRAIREAIISDEDFIGLNAKFVNRALNRARERMAQNTPKVDMSLPENNPNIVTGAARDEWLEKWKAELQKAEAALTAPDYQEKEKQRRINERRKAWGFPEI